MLNVCVTCSRARPRATPGLLCIAGGEPLHSEVLSRQLGELLGGGAGRVVLSDPHGMLRRLAVLTVSLSFVHGHYLMLGSSGGQHQQGRKTGETVAITLHIPTAQPPRATTIHCTYQSRGEDSKSHEQAKQTLASLACSRDATVIHEKRKNISVAHLPSDNDHIY